MQKTTYFCDGCEIQKEESNHWWSVRVDGEGWTLGSFRKGVGQKIYCGQQCVLKALTEYMHEQMEK